MEKVDVIKRLIRSHNYTDIERVYLRCLELGIHVNRSALTRFSQKLALIDRASRGNDPQLDARKVSKQHTTSTSDTMSGFTGLVATTPRPQSHNVEPTPPPPSAPVTAATRDNEPMSFAQAKRREAEITFELGALKIKEHALLEELNALTNIIDEKH